MSESPRVLICTFDVIPGPTASSRRVSEYLKGLSERFQTVVLSVKTPDHSHIQKYHGARLLRVPVGNGDLASRLQAFDRAVRRQLESEEYALVHFTDPFGGYALCEQKESYGYRLLYDAQSFPSQELRYTHPQTEGDRRFSAQLRRQELYCLLNSEKVVTGSEVTRAFIQALGVPEDLIGVLRQPVDLSDFPEQALGKPDAVPMRVIYLGSQVAWQGLPTLLRAMREALHRTDVRLQVVGPRHPDWQPRLEDLVNELQLQGKVEFLAPVAHEELGKVLSTADAAVLPLEDLERNRTQGGPLGKVSDYLAAGRPVISADLPVSRAALPEGTALFYPPGDAVALGARLVELASNPALRVQMGRAARAEAQARLASPAIQAQLLDVYVGLVGGARRTVEPPTSEETSIIGTPTNQVPSAIMAPKEVEGPPTDPAISLARFDGERGPAPEAPVVIGSLIEEPAISSPTPGPSPAFDSAPTASSPPAAPAPWTPPRPAASPVAEGASAAQDPLPSAPESPSTAPAAAAAPSPSPSVAAPSAPAPPVLAIAPLSSIASDEPEEVSSDEIFEAEAESLIPTPSRRPSPVDFWLAQIVQGYCPTGGQTFARPPPPTTFPGRASEVPTPPRPPHRTEDSSPGFKP